MSSSFDVARGGYDLSKASANTSGGKKRQRTEVSMDTTTAPAEAISKYKNRHHDPNRSLEGAVMKKRPGKAEGGFDKKAEARLANEEKRRVDGAIRAAEAEILNTTEGGFLEVETEMERTYKLRQEDLKKELDEQSARQIYDLSLAEYAPYHVSYSREGRHLLLAGAGGHIALMDALTLTLKNELYLNASRTGLSKTSVRASTFLHNSSLYALAESKGVVVYDDRGAEVHNMSDHVDPLALTFMPYHWLLASIGRAGYLKYTDTSSGNLVSTHRTKLGPCRTLAYSNYNAVLHCGHGNGTVTLWAPNSSTHLAKMMTHRGAVTSLAIDLTGNYMVSGGVDRQVKVWDLRTFKALHAYFSVDEVSSLDISQRGVLAVGGGRAVTYWKDALAVKAQSPYMSHEFKRGEHVSVARFRPFEDVCGIGHSKGFSSVVIPGVGEPNFDGHASNMFADKKQRQETEVRALLDKLGPDTITLDPMEIGTVERDRSAVMKEQREAAEEANRNKPKDKEKHKARGRNKISKKLAKKHKNIVDEGVTKLREKVAQQKAERTGEEVGVTPEDRKKIKGLKEGGALKRFFA